MYQWIDCKIKKFRGTFSRLRQRDREVLRRSLPSRVSGRNRDHHRRTMSVDARPFVPAENLHNSTDAPSMPDISSSGNHANGVNSMPNEHLTTHQQQLGDRLYPKVYNLHPTFAGRITGMWQAWFLIPTSCMKGNNYWLQQNQYFKNRNYQWRLVVICKCEAKQ